jgi:crossover junction endodeoxyribonuclease RuvC
MSEKNPRIIGIDPGVNGAYSVLGSEGEFINSNELPRFQKTINGSQFAKIVNEFKPNFGIIERVSSMPRQGVSSTFTFGQAFGVVQGVLSGCDVPFVLVTPGLWKKHFRLIGQPKDASRELAQRLFPAAELHLKRHVGRADALLIARYHLDQHLGRKFS